MSNQPHFLFISVMAWVLQGKWERCYLCAALRDILISKLGKWEILPLWVDGYPRSYIP